MNINSINVNKYPISQILDPESKTVYEIPKYQREYIWGAKQWEELFNDLMENGSGYFLGSIICINTTQDTLNNPKFEVVDGQQRLTTLSLLLAALYVTLDANRDKLDEEQQSDILQLKRKLVLKRAQSDIRIVPQVQHKNLEDYLALLAEKKIIAPHQTPKFAGNRRIFQSYNYFKKRIDGELEASDDQVATMFEILEKVNTAILVIIEVSNHSDAYTLFESLNDRGTPLTALDLIKNLLLARMDVTDSGNLDYYFGRWTQVIDALGDDDGVRERFFRQNYNAFRKDLNAPFIVSGDDRPYPLGTIATRSTMLDIYEKIVTKDPVKFLDEIYENAQIYSKIILQNTDDLTSAVKEAYLDLQRVGGVPSYLFLLYLEKKMGELEIDETLYVKIIRFLITFFVRRNMTDVPPTRDLTRLFIAFIEEMEKQAYTGANIYTKLYERLVAVSADDASFEEKLRGQVYKENTGATRFILCMIAKRGMTAESQKNLWEKNVNNQYIWTIEHIFPEGKNIPDSWVKMIADGDRAKADGYLEEYAHTFGNLTITGYNSSLGNKSFKEKKERKDNNGNPIGYLNGLNLNSDLVDKDKWTVDLIKARTDKLVKEILEMFKL
jgi:uncharacterized protein with ParB-like and HNH nuclease domain